MSTEKKSCCTPSASSVAGSMGKNGEPIGQSSAVDHAGKGLKNVDTLQVELAAVIREAPVSGCRAHGENLVAIEGGAFLMGTDSDEAWEADGEGPVREVVVRPFHIDKFAVTNAQYGEFVKATGYVTDSEKFGWSFAFRGHLSKKYAAKLGDANSPPGLRWWVAVPGARWDRPEGERSNLKGREDHPVTHVSWNDAMAYCHWSGKRLLTEAEWEYAARGGLVQKKYPWGDALEPLGKHRCNIWQGKFPDENTAADGYVGTCPVDAFLPNGYGLYCMSGNVWEWTSDWFSPTWHVDADVAVDEKLVRDNPVGPPQEYGNGLTHKLQKGGSFLCHRSYCNRYRVAARTGNTPDSSTANSGFRCACDAE